MTPHPHEAAFLAAMKRISHLPERCAGQTCVIHNPAMGPWRGFYPHYRTDRNIVERICPHGTGHPDPSQSPYWAAIDQQWQSVHGCDGCCSGWGIVE